MYKEWPWRREVDFGDGQEAIRPQVDYPPPPSHGEFEIYGPVSRPVRLEPVPWTDRRCRVGLGFVDEQEAIFGLSQSLHMTKMKYRRRRRWQPEEGGFRQLSQGQLAANRSAVSFSKGGRRFQKKWRIKKLK